MQVFTSSQQLFKQQLDSDSQASAMSISPPGSPLKTPLPPKKRKIDSMPVTSSLLSPSTSSNSSILISPESSGGGLEGEAAHGSETDDASECPPELVQERLNLSKPFRAQNNRGRKMQPRQPVPLFKVQQQANYFQHGRLSFFFKSVIEMIGGK
jgi:hypothetical protein